MPDENVTTKFKVDISELKSGITAANRQIKMANAEFNAATSGMDDWEHSADGLQAKLEQLEKTIAAETSKLKNYRKQLDKVEAAEAENTSRAEKLRDAYERAASQFGKNSDEAKRLKKALNDVEKEQANNAKAADDLRLKILNQTGVVNRAEREQKKFSDALKDLQDKTKKGKKEVVKFEDAVRDLNGGFTVAKAAIADFISDGLQNLISGVKDTITSFINLGDETQEFRTQMSRAETAFIDAGHGAETANKMYQEFYGILGDEGQTVEAISHLAQLTDNQEQLSQWTNIATGVYAKFGDSLPIENLTEAANETARTGELTGGLTDAINWGAKAGETFGVTLKQNTKENEEWNKAVQEATSAEDFFALALEECTTQAEREKLIRETLNGIYSEAGDKYLETTGSIVEAREAQARLTDQYADFGERVEPIMITVKNGWADVLEVIASTLDEADLEKIQTAISDAFTWFIDTGIPAIKNGFQWVLDNKDGIIAAITGIVAGFAAFKIVGAISNAIGLFTNFFNVIKGGKGVWAALNAVMGMNPIMLIIAAVAALVGAFIYLWNNCDEFREFWYNLWDAIVEAFNATVEWFKGAAASVGQFFSDAWQYIKNVWSEVTEFFSGIWNGITDAFSATGAWFSKQFTAAKNGVKNAWSGVTKFFSGVWNGITGAFSTVGSWFSTAFSDAWSGITSAFSNVGKFFSGVWETVTGAFSDAFDGMASIGKNIIEGLWNGISNMGAWISEKLRGFGENVLGSIKSFFGIASPSKVMAKEVGRWIPPGIAEGITDNIGKMKSAIGKAVGVSKDVLAGETDVGNSSNSMNSFVFNQYNNSPKALSRLDIYRQTQNQLRTLKGWS